MSQVSLFIGILPSRGNVLQEVGNTALKALEGNLFVRLIWIASATSLNNIHLLLHFEIEITECIEMHICTHIKANPMYCSLWGDFFVFTLAQR